MIINSHKNDSRKNILYLACESGNIDIIKYILSLNTIDINAKFTSKDEGTVYHYAIKNIEIVKVLLDNQNIDVNIKYI